MYPFKQSFKPMNSENGANKEVPQHQWPLNPAAYQNVCNDEVDWAALAQQWIYMKETCPYEGMPEAPPPPNISNTISKKEYEEKGEAPMEVEKDDEQIIENATFIDTTIGSLIGSDLSDLSNTQNVPNWGAAGWNSHGYRKKPGWNTWTNPNMAASSSQTMIHHIRPQPLLPDPNMYNDIDLRTTDGYWSSNQRFPSTKSNHTQSGSNQGDQSPKSNSDSQPEPFSLDAAKRKTLPAWIRQGLEKMEREKQKVAEKERDKKERLANQQKVNEVQGVNAIPGDISFNAKSKFDSESDSDDDIKEQKISISTSNRILNPVIAKRPHKSKQEQLQDLMLTVRQTLTEILLEVTNEEIKSIASDTLSKKRSKARKAQPVRKTALSSLTGGLGLGIYADSDNSGNSSSDDSNDESQSDEIDSDVDLKESLKRRKLSFELKEKEIEAALAIEEEKEKRWLDDGKDEAANLSVNNEGNPGTASADKDTGEIQHENNLKAHGTRREKKASRFSDPTDTVNNLRVAHGSIIYELKSNAPSKIDTTKMPFVQTPLYDEHKDSDSSSNSSKRRKRRKSHNSSSGDSGPDSRYYNSSRKRYNRSNDKNRNRSRSSSSERSHHRISSYSNRNRGSPNRKSYHYEDRATSSSKDMHKVSSSYRDDRTRSYSNSSSKDSYSRKRSRSRSSSKTRKYNYSRY